MGKCVVVATSMAVDYSISTDMTKHKFNKLTRTALLIHTTQWCVHNIHSLLLRTAGIHTHILNEGTVHSWVLYWYNFCLNQYVWMLFMSKYPTLFPWSVICICVPISICYPLNVVPTHCHFLTSRISAVLQYFIMHVYLGLHWYGIAYFTMTPLSDLKNTEINTNAKYAILCSWYITMHTHIMHQCDASSCSCRLENHNIWVQNSKVYMWTRYCTCTSLKLTFI